MKTYWIHCGTHVDPFEYGSQLVLSEKSAQELSAAIAEPMAHLDHQDRPQLNKLFTNLDMSNPYIPAKPGVTPDGVTGVYSIQEATIPVL